MVTLSKLRLAHSSAMYKRRETIREAKALEKKIATLQRKAEDLWRKAYCLELQALEIRRGIIEERAKSIAKDDGDGNSIDMSLRKVQGV